MSEINEAKSPAAQGKDQIDLSSYLLRLLHALKRVGWIIPVLAILLGGLKYFRTSSTYVVTYTAEATLTVTSTNSSSYSSASDDISTAQQMGKVFPYILSSGILSDMVGEELGTRGIPASVSVEVVENTNLITIRATASDGELAYRVLQSVIHNYPEVALYVVGQTEIDILKDSGVPGPSSATYLLRGSMRNGLIMGFALGCAIVAVYTALHRTILNPSDFNAFLHVKNLGTLPEFRVKKHRKNAKQGKTILSANTPQDYLEAIRAVRTRVERRLKMKGQKTFMVTSSAPGEGKSTVCTNLAITFAQKGLRVVLVDCDLRHPSVQGIMDLKGNFPGIGNVLSGKTALKDAICRVKSDSMTIDVICGSKESSHSVSMLGGRQMKAVIEELERNYDLVILDISPSALLADAAVMARNVSLALYVVRYDYASTRKILDGIEELAETGIDIFGCVLNRGNFNASPYGHSGYGYRNGYGSRSRKRGQSASAAQDNEKA